MIKTRIAHTTALVTFGLAALGGTALAVAAPGNAAPTAPSHSVTADTKMNPHKPNKFDPTQHDVFPQGFVSPHAGHGHKGMDEFNAGYSQLNSQRVASGVFVPNHIQW